MIDLIAAIRTLVGPMLAVILLSACSAPVTPTPAVTRVRPTGTLLFSAVSGNGSFNLYAMDANGFNRRQLTDRTSDVLGGKWSPDGRQIVAVLEGTTESQLLVMNDSGGDPRAVVTATHIVNPAWSPDGQAVVYVSGEAGRENIFYLKLDGSVTRRLTQTAGSHLQPAFSPDGTQIAYISNESGSYQVYLMPVNGPGRRITRQDQVNHQYPAWSRDGRYLAFAADATGNDELYVLDTHTGDARPLTRDGLPAIQPAWSPDDSLLAYTVNTAKGFRLYLATVDGAARSPIDLSSPTDEYFPDWKK